MRTNDEIADQPSIAPKPRGGAHRRINSWTASRSASVSFSRGVGKPMSELGQTEKDRHHCCTTGESPIADLNSALVAAIQGLWVTPTMSSRREMVLSRVHCAGLKAGGCRTLNMPPPSPTFPPISGANIREGLRTADAGCRPVGFRMVSALRSVRTRPHVALPNADRTVIASDYRLVDRLKMHVLKR
jgi:hypothetical protein